MGRCSRHTQDNQPCDVEVVVAAQHLAKERFQAKAQPVVAERHEGRDQMLAKANVSPGRTVIANGQPALCNMQ